MSKLDELLQKGEYSITLQYIEDVMQHGRMYTQAVIEKNGKWVFTAAGKDVNAAVKEAYENLPVNA